MKNEPRANRYAIGSGRGLPAPELGSLPGFAARLPVFTREPLPPDEMTPRRAFESLVSAACYLSLASPGDPASTLEAVQLLHEMALGLQDDGLDLGALPERMEDRIWRNRQLKWERHRSVGVALRFIKEGSEEQEIGDVAEAVKPWAARSWFAHLWEVARNAMNDAA